jgi:hypothetical protein
MIHSSFSLISGTPLAAASRSLRGSSLLTSPAGTRGQGSKVRCIHAGVCSAVHQRKQMRPGRENERNVCKPEASLQPPTHHQEGGGGGHRPFDRGAQLLQTGLYGWPRLGHGACGAETRQCVWATAAAPGQGGHRQGSTQPRDWPSRQEDLASRSSTTHRSAQTSSPPAAKVRSLPRAQAPAMRARLAWRLPAARQLPQQEAHPACPAHTPRPLPPFSAAQAGPYHCCVSRALHQGRQDGGPHRQAPHWQAGIPARAGVLTCSMRWLDGCANQCTSDCLTALSGMHGTAASRALRAQRAGGGGQPHA